MKKTKVDRLETHDRFIHLIKNGENLAEICRDITDQRPFGNFPFYLFVHKREMGLDERWAYWIQTGCVVPMEELPSARLIWQPRLTKPEAQENSMLFKCTPGCDQVRIIWMLPQRELWPEYEKGKMLENEVVITSIKNFLECRQALEAPESEDPDDDTIRAVYAEIARQSVRLKT